MLSGATAGMGGIIFAAQVNSVALTFPPGNLLLNAIASAVIGGVSLFGGRGEVRGALLGAHPDRDAPERPQHAERVERLDLHHHRPRAPRRRHARHVRRPPAGPLRPLSARSTRARAGRATARFPLSCRPRGPRRASAGRRCRSRAPRRPRAAACRANERPVNELEHPLGRVGERAPSRPSPARRAWARAASSGAEHPATARQHRDLADVRRERGVPLPCALDAFVISSIRPGTSGSPSALYAAPSDRSTGPGRRGSGSSRSDAATGRRASRPRRRSPRRAARRSSAK